MEQALSRQTEPHLAIATIPMQDWETPWNPAQGLQQGTIFPSLYLPFFVTSDALKPTGAKGGGIHV